MGMIYNNINTTESWFCFLLHQLKGSRRTEINCSTHSTPGARYLVPCVLLLVLWTRYDYPRTATLSLEFRFLLRSIPTWKQTPMLSVHVPKLFSTKKCGIISTFNHFFHALSTGAVDFVSGEYPAIFLMTETQQWMTECEEEMSWLICGQFVCVFVWFNRAACQFTLDFLHNDAIVNKKYTQTDKNKTITSTENMTTISAFFFPQHLKLSTTLNLK